MAKKKKKESELSGSWCTLLLMESISKKMHCVKIVERERENYLPYTLIYVLKLCFSFSTENKNDLVAKNITQGN